MTTDGEKKIWAGGAGIDNSSPSVTEFPSLMATDYKFRRLPLPCQFPPPKHYVTISVAKSVATDDGILKFHRRVLSDERKSDSRIPWPIPSLMSKFRR